MSLEPETVLGPVETDSDSHRPLMSDDEDDRVEVYARSQSPGAPAAAAAPPRAIGFCQAFLLPGVLPVSVQNETREGNLPNASHRCLTSRCSVPQYSLSYACLKLVNYAFFFWLPFYLNNNYGWKEAEADRLSVWYDVGGIVGESEAGVRINDTKTGSVVLHKLASPAQHGWTSPELVPIDDLQITKLCLVVFFLEVEDRTKNCKTHRLACLEVLSY